MAEKPIEAPDEDPGLLQLLVQAKAGSSDAEAEFFEQCRGYLIAVASQELDETLRPKVAVSDVVQETVIRAQRHLDVFECRSQGELFAWLRTILRNQMTDVRRKYRVSKKRDVNRETSPIAAESSRPMDMAIDSLTPGRNAAANEEVEQLRHAITALSDDDRQVIALRSWEQLSFSDIGKRMNRSPDAARVLWGRAVRRLGQQMQCDDTADD